MLAPPGIVVAEGLAGVSGLECKIILDATNRLASQTPAPDGYDSIAEYVNATTGGSVAKMFNLIYGAILDQAAGTARRPGNPATSGSATKAPATPSAARRGDRMETLYGGPLSGRRPPRRSSRS